MGSGGVGQLGGGRRRRREDQDMVVLVLSETGNRKGQGNASGEPGMGLRLPEGPDAPDASAEGPDVIQDSGKSRHETARRAFFEQMEQGQAVIPGGADEATLQNALVANFLPHGNQAAECQPDGGIEPMEDLDAGQNPILSDVAAFDVCEFVKKQEPDFVGGQTFQKASGQENPGPPRTRDRGRHDALALDEEDGTPDAHDRFALLEKVQDVGIRDRNRVLERVLEPAVIAIEQETEDGGSGQPQGEGDQKPGRGIGERMRNFRQRYWHRCRKPQQLEGDMGDAARRKFHQIEKAESAGRGNRK